MELGDKLKKMRKQKKLTQLEVANIIGIDDTTISKYENNRSEPDNETLRKLADLYKCTFDYLLGYSDDPNTYKNGINDIEIREFMEVYRTLNEEEKKVVRAVVKQFTNKGGE